MTCTIIINNANILVNYQDAEIMTEEPLFDANAAQRYDQGMESRVPGYTLAQDLAAAVLATTLPNEAKILVVGVGTGSEILHLAQTNPLWRFTALDISRDMLAVAHTRLENAGLIDRVEFVCAPMQLAGDLPQHDAGLMQLVGQFVRHTDKPAFYRAIAQTLAPDAPLLSLDYRPARAPSFASLRQWASRAGAHDSMLEMMQSRIEKDWHIPNEADLMLLWQDAGLKSETQYSQALAYIGTVLRRQ